jgi:hypothetical protein
MPGDGEDAMGLDQKPDGAGKPASGADRAGSVWPHGSYCEAGVIKTPSSPRKRFCFLPASSATGSPLR